MDEALKKRWKRSNYKIKNVSDVSVVSSDLLIENIDLAFEAWRRRKWSKYYSFEGFCDYVLPYRINNEPLENWRKL